MNYWKLCIIALSFSCFTACDDSPEDDIEQQTAPQEVTTITGFYLLNEGMLSQDNATLDQYDYATGTYTKGVFMKANADVTSALGSVANDILIYGSKVYIVMNNSDKVEVLNRNTNKRIKMITLKSGRNICAANGKVYITSHYNSKDAKDTKGSVIEIDTTDLTISKEIVVGRQPEGITYANNKLYVANSGWKNAIVAADYEKTVSVINLPSYTNGGSIEAGINLSCIVADKYGYVYVNSKGDFAMTNQTLPKLVVIDSQTDKVTRTYPFSGERMALAGDSLYIIGSYFDTSTFKDVFNYNLINTKSNSVSGNFITDGSESKLIAPYGIAVDPISRNIYIPDAKSYYEEGILYFFDKDGKKIQMTNELKTGIIPSKIAFISKTEKVEK